MSELSFFEIPNDFDEKIEKSKQIIETQKKHRKTYASESALQLNTDQAFDFEKEKKLFLEDLNFLKSLSVEEFTFRKKWEEIAYDCNEYVLQYASQAKARIWAPTDIDNEELTIKEISELDPIVIVCNDESSERLWTTLRYFCSTAEFNQAPGRFIKFLTVDRKTQKVLGVMSIASDVISISDRDSFIGWTSDDKLIHRMLKYSAIGTTIVPTQPFGSNFLGGKLVAAMITSDVVRNSWEFPDKGDSTPCKLVGMTTTSLYGNKIVTDESGNQIKKGGLSMYSSLKWWKQVGLSKGKIPIKTSEKTYKLWHQWLKQHRTDDYNKSMTHAADKDVSGPVTGAKSRVLNMIFEEVGVKQSNFVHGFERGVYYSCFYENTKEFLQRKITEDQLKLKPLFARDVVAIVEWWKPKAIERYKKLKSEGRITREKLFYGDMRCNGRIISYEEAKNRYFSAVGR